MEGGIRQVGRSAPTPVGMRTLRVSSPMSTSGPTSVSQPRDGRADEVGGDVAVGVCGTRGHVGFQRLEGLVDRLGAVAEDVDRARAELNAADTLRDEGDAQSSVELP